MLRHQSGVRLWTGRLTVLLALILSALSLRLAVTSLTPLLGRIGADLGFGTTVTGVLGMVPTVMFAIAGWMTPRLVRRIGLQHAAVLAMVLATLGLASRAMGGTAVLLVSSAVALAGMGIGNVVVPPLVKLYFPDRVGTMSSVYITALQLGTTLPPLAAVPVADAAGWRWSLAAWAGVSMLALFPWLRVLRHTGAEPHAIDEPVARPAESRVWRSPVALGLAMLFSMTSLNTYAMFTWLPQVLTEAGHTAAFGGAMVGLFSGVGLGSALLAPTLAARMRNPFPVVVGSVIAFAAGYLGLLLATDAAPVLWVVLVGAGPTTFPLALTLINLRTRTHGGSAALSGFAQGVGYAVASTGPLLFGLLHDATGGWGAPFAFLGITLVVLLIGGAIACRPRFLEDSWMPVAAGHGERPAGPAD